jgi:phosphoribosyl 1,2-cyclic phosphodiesterase
MTVRLAGDVRRRRSSLASAMSVLQTLPALPAGTPRATDLTVRTAAAALRVTCWGTRGSIASPGAETTRFGGNTPCVEMVTPGGRRLLFDAGTGIRRLGARLAALAEPVSAELFLTHFHWDHIQGLPFFAPMYDARTRLRIHGPEQQGQEVEALFAQQMSRMYFPVPYEALAATLEFRHVSAGIWTDDEVEVAAFRTCHPGNTYGYRLRLGGACVAYVPDNELAGDGEHCGAAWREALVEFVRGADVLFHDAMYTDAEYAQRRGWGHSTFAQAVALAEEAGVRRLLLFHHDPDRGDDELGAAVETLRADLTARGSSLTVEAACEGLELLVVEPPR